MTVSLQAYLNRITPWQSTRPRFVATVSGVLAPFVEASVVISGVPGTFDLDTAIGKQLDTVGEWVGRSRYVSLPIPQPWFAFNDALYGFGRGVWKGPYRGTYAVSSLDDETFRRLLRANTLAKRWDGTVPGAQAAFDAFFVDPDTHVFVQDNAQVPYPQAFFSFGTPGRGFGQGNWYKAGADEASTGAVDVSMTIGVSGKIPAPILLGLMAQNAILIKPGGVAVNYAVTTLDRAPLFGFGVQNEFVSGFGAGAWGSTPERLIAA